MNTAAWGLLLNGKLNVDAEEADRLELSLDLLEALAFDPDLTGWNGIGFVVEAANLEPPL